MSHRKRLRYVEETGAIVVQTRSAISRISMVDLSQHGVQTVQFHDSCSRCYGHLDEHNHRFPNLDKVVKRSKGKHICIIIKLYGNVVVLVSYLKWAPHSSATQASDHNLKVNLITVALQLTVI